MRERSMQLPRGITGFYHRNEILPTSLSDDDIKDLKTHCFSIARNLHGKAGNIFKPIFTSNYHQVDMNINSLNFSILINDYYNYVGVVETSGSSELKFVPNDFIERYFLDHKKYIFLSSYELSKTPDSSLLFNLSKAELSQIKYWKPKSIGHIIFNHWD